jgi:hypothetical protein
MSCQIPKPRRTIMNQFRGVIMKCASPSNENKMSDGGRGCASLELEVWKSSQKWGAQQSAVRSIAWLDGGAAWNENVIQMTLLIPIQRWSRLPGRLLYAAVKHIPLITK